MIPSRSVSLPYDSMQEKARARQTKSYQPWPEDVVYSPGEGDAPQLMPAAKYGDTPHVGDLPRIGKRAGDPRCQDRTGFVPCQSCVFEHASTQHYEGDVMPGLASADTAGKNPYSGMPFPLSHPFKGPTPDMNTGRGCDVYGKPYKEPLRYLYLTIHKFDEEAEDYETTKSYEVDFGPNIDSEEFREGLRKWKATEDFHAYSEEQLKKDKNWKWEDPVEDKPWEICQMVKPNPWLTDSFDVSDPVDQHVSKIKDWASRPHQTWPHATERLSLEAAPAAKSSSKE